MFKDIISNPKTNYLGFGIMMPWENNLKIQFDFWKDSFTSGKINQLKKLCGSEQVIGLFCYKCDMVSQTFSYHIACENKRNVQNKEFEKLTLEESHFARFEISCTDFEQRFETYNSLCEEIWEQWLPNSNYVSLIEPETFGCVEGYTSVEIYTPENPTNSSYKLEMLLPVKNK